MSVSSVSSHISLIDLTKQLPFEIDPDLKKQLCFAETLVISCGHYEGDVVDAESDSEWSCQDSSTTEPTVVAKSDLQYEVKDKVEEEPKEEENSDDDNNFHFFFFPDCKKPLPSQDSKASLLMVDGFPKINEAAIDPITCACDIDTDTGKCSCVSKLPCSCGATVKAQCTCEKLQSICICHDGDPQPVCTCKESQVCICHPDGKPRPICTCEQIDKPCVCHPDRFPFRECECKHKPTFMKNTKVKSVEEAEEIEEGEVEDEIEELSEEIGSEQQPCECQKEEPKPHCLCLVGQECICNQVQCICGVRKTCVCEPTNSQEPICKDSESKSICSCDVPQGCKCDNSGGICKCFPKPMICNCGDPENCTCHTDCECINPCLCTDLPKKEECVCLDYEKQEKGFKCTCPTKTDGPRKLKKVRAGKQGYRWCNEVDPHHTFFGYGYDRHDKISYGEPLIPKINIIGLHDEKLEEGECAVHGVKAPPFKKKVRKPSLDCCSAVGGISISVETLGEDQDKFLVQVVSHSSKEGAKTGSRIVSILDMNLHTMEENRTENITQKDRTKERRSYMAICENGYYNKLTYICGDRNVIKRHYHSFKDAKSFLLEGANVVLMRYFGLRRFRGTVKTDTVMIGGQICESIYVSLGVSQAVVNGKPLFVVKVERHIIEPGGSVHQTLTVLTLRGYMVSHEWADNSYILHLNPLLNIVPEKDEIEQHEPLRERWRDDLQLFSDYLDYKSARTSEGARYAEENGGLTGTIREYLQALLLLKPCDAFHFTRHYFGSALSALDLPHNEYFEPASKRVHYFFLEE